MNVISAYMLINKAIPSTGGPYTVRFYDDEGNLIQTDANVPQYGTAHCTLLDGSVVNGLYFKGWNPAPTVVVQNLDCYPVRGDYIIRPEETHDSWETICADAGAHYPLGTYKALVINIPARTGQEEGAELFKWSGTDGKDWFTQSPPQNNGFAMSLDMVKVAEGEDGSTSTWLSTGVIPVMPFWQGGGVGYTSNVGAFAASGVHYEEGGWYEGLAFDWLTSVQREYLNNFFISQLPEVLQSTIKDVTKSFASFVRAPVYCGYADGWNYGDSKIYKSSLDKIWIPSMKELHTLFAGQSGYDNYSGSEEPTGIDYSSVYVPSYATKFLTRTLYIGANFINPLTINGGVSPVTDSCPGVPFGFCL